MPHKIVFLIDSLGMGGAERLMVPYVERLAQSGFEVRVCALQVRDGNPMARDIEGLGVPVDLVPVQNLRSPGALPRLFRYLREHRPDVLHTQLQFANILGTIAAPPLHIPTVCTLHTIGNLDSKVRGYWRDKIMLWVLRSLGKRVVGVSEQTRQYYIQQAGFNAEQVVTLHNGINLEPFTTCPPAAGQAVREEFGIPPDAPLLITVAVLRPQKGIQYMIEAMPTILQTVTDARYLVAGSGEYAATLKAMVQERGLSERVIFAGGRSDIPALLTAADVFVLPTLTEALPTVLAEAMGTHTPIVASAVGGVPEMVEHERNGLLVPPEDVGKLARACASLLCDPEQAQGMGWVGLDIARQRFEIGVQAQRLGELYTELLEQRGKKGKGERKAEG